jgi:AraC-like DNA-binding protein/mannose-6-phosphate isomerase-like protein (cupin superfamily)
MVEMINLENQMKQLTYTRIFTDNTLPVVDNIVIIDKEFSSHHAHLEHKHDDMLELFYVLSGNSEYSVDKVFYTITAGDLLICNAGVLHGESPRRIRGLHSICCGLTNVKMTALPPNWLVDKDQLPLLHCQDYAKEIESLLSLLCRFSKEKKLANTVCSSLAVSLLVLLHEIARKTYRQNTEAGETDFLANRIRDYLTEHFNEPLTLSGVAAALHINPYYLSHILKYKTGCSPMQYVIQMRMGEAQTKLRFTNVPIAEIADSLGFSTPSRFDAAFMKNVGMSPSEYRLSFQKKTTKKNPK